MKKYLLLIMTALFLQSCSNDKTENKTQTESVQTAPSPKENKQTSTETWNGSSISDETIKQVQQDKYNYKTCVLKEAQKQGYQKMDTRVATDAVIKQCEQDLAKIRKTFINDGVPPVIADRFLKKTRIDMTRQLLQSLMFAEAARKAGATQ